MRELKEILHMESGMGAHSSLPMRLRVALVLGADCDVVWVCAAELHHTHTMGNGTVGFDLERDTLIISHAANTKNFKKYTYKMEQQGVFSGQKINFIETLVLMHWVTACAAHNVLPCIMHTHRFVCVIGIIMPTYNVHPYCSLKNWGKKVRIIHSKMQ